MLTIGPIILFYPFIQKYFAKGVMLGSLKGWRPVPGPRPCRLERCRRRDDAGVVAEAPDDLQSDGESGGGEPHGTLAAGWPIMLARKLNGL